MPQEQTIPQLRFLVFGAGAIGTYLGGSLALIGQRVVFLERPEPAAQLRQTGLRLRVEDRDLSIPNVKIAASVEEALTLGPYDVGIFAVKAYDTQPALEQLAPYAPALPLLLCLQNGVENEAAIASVLGAEKVIAGTVTSAVSRRDLGSVALERKRGVGIALGHRMAPALLAVLKAANLEPHGYASAASMKWSKLLTNLMANATSAILDLPTDRIFTHPGLFRLEMRQAREALAVMRAQRIRVVDLPHTPVRGLALAASLPSPLARLLAGRKLAGGRGAKLPSFHIDLYSGRGKSEVEFLNGAVARFGERYGVPTPVNRVLTRVLAGLTAGEIPLDAYAGQPDRLLADVRAEKERSTE